MVIVVLATNVAFTGLPSPSVSWYTTRRATLPIKGSGVVVVVGQAIWIPVRDTGYEPVGGVKRLSQRAALSPAVLPKPMEFSLVPSSSTNVMGSLGADPATLTDLPPEEAAEEAEEA